MMTAMMTAKCISGTLPRLAAPPLASRLRDLHRQWLKETSEWLTPALAPDADFWNGWSAVRYINDQFNRQYRRKCALVAAILPLLRPTDAFALCAANVLLERTRRDLDRIGRGQGATEAVRIVTWRFLHLLRTWLGEIERATKKLTVADPVCWRTACPRPTHSGCCDMAITIQVPPWRRMKPTPRTVASSGSPAALVNFRRRLPTWTSTTLLSGSKCMSHTFSSSVVRRTTSSG